MMDLELCCLVEIGGGCTMFVLYFGSLLHDLINTVANYVVVKYSN